MMSPRRRRPARPEPAAEWLPSAAELRARRARLRQRLAGAPAGTGDGEWPTPLVVAHLWRWDRTAVEEIRRQRRGDPPTANYRQFEAWNQWDESSREWLLEACWNHYADHLGGEY